MDRTSTFHGRQTEHHLFMGDSQNSPKTDQVQTTTTQVCLELSFLLLLLQPSIKLRKNTNSTMENEIPRLSPIWEHSLTDLLGHDHTTEPGMAPRHWVHIQGVRSLLDLLSWHPEELKTITTQQVYSLDDQGQYIHLRTNQVKQMCGLITYMKHIFEYIFES